MPDSAGKKRLKDPIYGYVELDEELCRDYVDTAEFQRLRRIVQTSYAPLFPSALHNRFVHSIGVYYLGCLAAAALDKCVRKLGLPQEVLDHWDDSVKTYKLACLLHDFGHSPFSHSGEEFYVPSSDEFKTLDDELAFVVGDQRFEDDRPHSDVACAAPHEIMSAILALETFGKIPNKPLFARVITGYKYRTCEGPSDYLDNVLIGMLNSSTIDVDRLDYLIRDSYVVGFDTVSIDYMRLLDGLRIVETTSGKYELAYHKSAISVMENVVYARDFEKKWIQAHPAILYDQFLLQHAIRRVVSLTKPDTSASLFSKQALTKKGLCVSVAKKEWTLDGSAAPSATSQLIRYASDDDIVFLAKNCFYDGLIEEYLDRSSRRHPIWKSEAEYRMLFHLDSRKLNVVERLQDLIAALEKDMHGADRTAVINSNALDDLNKELDAVDVNNPRESERAQNLRSYVDFFKALEQFSEQNGIDFDFAVLSFKGFKSGFKDGDFGETQVVFEDAKRVVCRLSDVSLSPKANEGLGERMNSLFYMFHRDAGKPGFPKSELIDLLINYYAPGNR